MSAAKQVYARALHVAVPKGVVKKLLSTALSSLNGDKPANIDTIGMYRPRPEGDDSAVVGNASALSIPSHPVRVVGNLLGLTNRQRDLLRTMTESVTANEFGKVEGSDAVFVSSTPSVATVTLHGLGFYRERDGGAMVPQRFVKTIERENGRLCVVTALMEAGREGSKVYTSLSVD